MSRLDQLQIGQKENHQKKSSEKKFSSFVFFNQLKELGFVVVPFIESKMHWSSEKYSEVWSACQAFYEKYSCQRAANPVIWLDAEGIILDFYCNESINGIEFQADLANIFSSMIVEAKKVKFKNGDICLRFLISFKTAEI